jgi:FkbM family methyltransferase
MASKTFSRLAVAGLTVVSSVHLGEESMLFSQSKMTSMQLDSHQYATQTGQQPAAPPIVYQEAETCAAMHDPNICDDATGKCVASINNLVQSSGIQAFAGSGASLMDVNAPVTAAQQIAAAAALITAEASHPQADKSEPAAPAAPLNAAQLFWKPFKMVTFQKDKYVSRLSLCHGHSWEDSLVLETLQGPLQQKKGWNFLDIGANLGSWTLPAAINAKAHGGKVISVEADPQTSGALRESVAMNSLLGDVSLVQKAVVRDSKAKTSICMSAGDVTKDDNIGGNQAELGSRGGMPGRICGKEVATTTIDDLFAADPSMGNVAAMKLDCEGCEGGAILGAHNFFTVKPPCFLAMEITEGYLCDSGTPLKEVKDFLHNHGYDTSSIKGPHGGETCAEYKEFEKVNGLQQEFVQLGRREASDAAACMARFQDKAAVL